MFLKGDKALADDKTHCSLQTIQNTLPFQISSASSPPLHTPLFALEFGFPLNSMLRAFSDLARRSFRELPREIREIVFLHETRSGESAGRRRSVVAKVFRYLEMNITPLHLLHILHNDHRFLCTK